MRGKITQQKEQTIFARINSGKCLIFRSRHVQEQSTLAGKISLLILSPNEVLDNSGRDTSNKAEIYTKLWPIDGRVGATGTLHFLRRDGILLTHLTTLFQPTLDRITLRVDFIEFLHLVARVKKFSFRAQVLT